VAIAGLCAGLFPFVSPSTDARYSLAWGAELLRGELPDLGPADLPTPHPLPIAVSVALAPLGAERALDAYEVLCALAFLTLVYALFRFGRALAGTGAGVLAAALVALNPRIDFFALRGFIDIPFAAAVMLAAALVGEQPRRNWARALGLLALAGLLRPEAWGLALLYALWLGFDDRARFPAALGLAVLGPAVWIGTDLLLAGDGLHSLHGTQAGADALGRTTGVDDLLPSLTAGLDSLIGWPLAAAGLLTAGWGLWRAYLPRGRRRDDALAGAERPAYLTAASLVVAGVGGFALLAVADLPLNDRYLVVPALSLVGLAAAAVMRASRSPVLAGAAVAAVAGTLVAAPADVRAIHDRFSAGRAHHRAEGELERLLDGPALRARLAPCERVVARGDLRAATASLLDRDPAAVPIADRPAPGEAGVVAPSVDGPYLLVVRCLGHG